MDIIQLTYDFYPNPLWGVAPHVRTLSKGLSEKGHLVSVVTRNPAQDPEFEYWESLRIYRTNPQIDRRFNYDPDLFTYKDFCGLDKLNEDLLRVLIKIPVTKPVVIHNHNWMTFPACLALARIKSIPIVTTVHFIESIFPPGEHPRGEAVREQILQWEQKMVQHSNVLILPSKAMMQKFENDYPFASPKAKVIHHGISFNYPQIKFPPKKEKKTVLFVGRFEKEKDPFSFINAAKMVLEKEPDTRFVMIGDGELLEEAEKIAQPSYAFRFTGQIEQPEVLQWMARSDLLAITSIYESFGLAALEAMFCELPVICPDVGALSELIEEGISGLKVPLREGAVDQDTLADRMVYLLRNQCERIRMAKKAKETAERYYLQEVMCQKTEAIYLDLTK